MKKKTLSLLLAAAVVLQLTTAAAFAAEEPPETVELPSSEPLQPFVVEADLSDFIPASPIEAPPEGSEYRPINNLPEDYRGPQSAGSLYDLAEDAGPLITAKNVVLPVRFQGEEEFTGKKGATAAGSTDKEEYFTQDIFTSLELMYNTGKYSIADYFSEMTFGEIQVDTTVAHGQGGDTASYETKLPRGCYEPMSEDNPEGYCGHFRIIPVYDAETGEPCHEAALIPEIRCDFTFENFDGTLPEDRWSDDIDAHVSAEHEENYVCSHMDAWYTREMKEEGNYAYTLSRELQSGEPSSHQWENSLCIDSYESDLRVYALFNECIQYLETYLESGGYTSTSLWYSGDCEIWAAALWPQTGPVQDFGKTDTEKLTNYMTDFVENPDIDASVYRLIANYVRTRYIDVAPDSPGAVLWGYLHNEGGADYCADPGEPIVNTALNDDKLGEEVAYTGDGDAEVKYPSISTACHEYGHVLGLPDEYCYANQSAPTTAGRSVMSFNMPHVPQYASTYTIAHYWPGVLAEENIREITRSGTYTLDCFSNHETREGKTFLYTLDLPTGDESHPEKLALEYRDSADGVSKYESTDICRSNLNSGLVLYQIDEVSELSGNGNMDCAATGPFAIAACRIEGQGQVLYGKEWYDQYPSYDPLQNRGTAREFYDINASALSNLPYYSYYEEEFPGVNSYGSADRSQTQNVIASQRTGKNTGVTITDVQILEAGKQFSFRLDFPEPEPTPQPSGGGGSRKAQYTLSASATEGGRIAPAGDRKVTEGGSARFTLEPDDGYRLASLWVDGRSVPLESVYTFRDVRANHTIRAVFAEIETMYAGDAALVKFPDLKGHWAKAAAAQMLELGLMNGTGRGFEPDAETTRAMFLTILYRYAGSPETEAAGTAWYAAPLAWAEETGLSDGSDPGAWVTREQVATLLWRLSGTPSAEPIDYADRDTVSPWAAEAMDWAVSAGVLTGGDRGFLRPDASATRAELATILSRYLARTAP